MGPKILHRPGLIRPSGSQGQSRIFGPIGSISQSIADTRYIIVVKLIKPVIANPTEGQEGLRPVWWRVLRTSTGRVWLRPASLQGWSRILGPIGSISRSIADTRYIIVVKLIKPVIANPTDRKEGLRPVRSPKSFSEAPSPSTISFYVNSVYNSSEIDKIRYCQPNW